MSAGLGAAALEGAVAGYGVAVPVGAVAALLVSLTARTSLRVGVAAALGVATADGIYCAAAVVGGTAAAGLIAPVAGPLRAGAVVVLLAIAARTAWTAWARHRDGPTARPATGLDTPGRAYAGLLALTALNPSTVVYFVALVLGRDAGHTSGPAAAVFVTAAFAASASWQLLLAGSGGVLGRVLTGPRGRLTTAWCASAVVTALAIRLLVG